MKIVIVSGYFDPIHVGHIEYIEKARGLGDWVVAIVNSDQNALDKKGHTFMPYEERAKIVKALQWVDHVVPCIDTDGSVCKSVEGVAKTYSSHEIIFAKGGDRTADEIPEAPICKALGIKIIDGLGKKIQSSSKLVRRLKNGKSKAKNT